MISPCLLAAGLPLSIISILVLLSLCDTGVRAYATPIPVFGPLDHVYNLTIGNESYPLRYGFSSGINGTAVIETMSANYTSNSIKVIIDDNSTTTEERFFIIELPRNVFNANTTELAAGCSSVPPSWVQEHDIDFNIVVSIDSEGEVAVFNGSQNQECGRDTRTLSIEYLGGRSTIIIQGTTMIPEFGSIAMAVAAIAVIAVVVVGKKTFYQKH